jgi:hypothetical protein
MEWFASKGALVLVPFGHSPDYDLVADFGHRLARVQVKTCTARRRNRWETRLSTSGGNQSWNGVVKRFDPSRCDYLFVLVGDGRRWCIPASALDAGTHLLLGGPKYEAFEVERGHRLPPRSAAQPGSTIVSLDPSGGCPSG